ncbi:hypothetical protein [Kribbella sp.]|uniref:WD40/YVTN/BNR-like repeat-containing protein n=1 Tax=Kribbella sp. TaxID=1871183 RepID=UPI002D698CD4|nr:hypothetical protein [Kribbella sp.]HZX06838.1 hypothetical protein [Kribbella sp.]
MVVCSPRPSTIADEFQQARTAPGGIVAPGAYSAAFGQLSALPHTAGTWHDVTKVPYNADDARYRDWFSNSSGGAGHVTGRITGLAADNANHVYAAGANGGVWRSSTGGGNWTPLSDSLPSLSRGDLQLAGDGSLWYATGEANTGGTSYVGSGVYRLANPVSGTYAPSDRVGGKELESTTVGRLRWGGGQVFAATNRGIWYHDASTTAGAWKVAFYPKNPKHVIAAIGWRSGDTYNGFYETNDYTAGPSSWKRLNVVLGGIKNSTDVGYTTFAFSKNGDRLYALVQQPSKINGSTSLAGIFVSKTGSPSGPWNKIADPQILHNSGSALDRKGYAVGVQAWYNQFLTVDPANADHVWAGLEEVFETSDAGSHWSAVAPYWNFGFSCWNLDDAKNSCPMAPHSDQHSVAVGTSGGKPVVLIGNDGGIYSRSARTPRTVAWWCPAVCRTTVSRTCSASGRTAATPTPRWVSNFGGDGGDGTADPANGCNQLQEYVALAVKITNNCAVNKGALSAADATSWSLDPGDPDARFIAPIAIDSSNPNGFIAGGQYVYTSAKGWGMRSPSEWTKAFDLGAGHSATAVAMRGGTGWVSWCGPCNNAGFARGLATNAGGTWHQVTLPSDFPNRYLAGVGIDPGNGQHAYVAVNGFSRRFTEGPGAGVGHVYETRDGGTTWSDISANLPDIPTSAVKQLANGALVVGSDLATFYRAPGATNWQVLGTGLPTTTVMDIESGPDGNIYAATHGRGIWSITPPA